MRGMILNHASLVSPDRQTAVDWLRDAVVGMSTLVRERLTERSLRMRQAPYEVACLTGWSLYDAYEELRRSGARDEYGFLVRLSSKVPLLNDMDPEVVDRFHGCQAKTLPHPDGEPLVLCAITDGIAVGFPSEPVWDRDQLTVEFGELLPNNDIGHASESIDNLTRFLHAQPICDRHRASLRDAADPASAWNDRQLLFPALVFAPGVENNFENLTTTEFWVVLKRLASIDGSARAWPGQRGPNPPWTCNVTPESHRVRQNPILIGRRYFRSHTGRQELFEWHARFGSDGRIHLRFDPASYEVEIGYIGKHLPL